MKPFYKLHSIYRYSELSLGLNTHFNFYCVPSLQIIVCFSAFKYRKAALCDNISVEIG